MAQGLNCARQSVKDLNKYVIDRPKGRPAMWLVLKTHRRRPVGGTDKPYWPELLHVGMSRYPHRHRIDRIDQDMPFAHNLSNKFNPQISVRHFRHQ
jgi:hypothetical protein